MEKHNNLVDNTYKHINSISNSLTYIVELIAEDKIDYVEVYQVIAEIKKEVEDKELEYLHEKIDSNYQLLKANNKIKTLTDKITLLESEITEALTKTKTRR